MNDDLIVNNYDDFKILQFSFDGGTWEIIIDLDIVEDEYTDVILRRISELNNDYTLHGGYHNSDLIVDFRTKNN